MYYECYLILDSPRVLFIQGLHVANRILSVEENLKMRKTVEI
jgi:hypothetical protein